MSTQAKPAPLSRGEVETLCVLHAIGREGCPTAGLAARLGLSASLAPAIAAGVEPLVISGLLEVTDDRFRVTSAGRTTLATRLSELGLG